MQEKKIIKASPLESQLEIFIVTYNRAAELKKTFFYMQKTPFVNCSLVIFDNCSTDETQQVCQEILLSNVFKGMKVVRHPYNIGGNANILKVFQSATFNYTWILADDDYIEPEGWDDVIAEIQKGDAASILLNTKLTKKHDESYYASSRGKHFTWDDLIKNQGCHFNALAFVPNSINRLDLIRKHLAEAAMFCGFSFPHLAMHTLADKNTIYYCSKNSLIQCNISDERTGGRLYYPLPLYYLRTYQFIEDKKLRSYAISQMWKMRGGERTPLRIWAVTFLSLGVRYNFNLSKKIRIAGEIFLFSNPMGRFFALLLFPLIFIPSQWVAAAYYLLTRKKLVFKVKEELQRGRI